MQSFTTKMAKNNKKRSKPVNITSRVLKKCNTLFYKKFFAKKSVFV
jgi:hypothetical protein